MHRIAATPGGWNPGDEGVMFVAQTPGAIVLLTAADTDIHMLAAARDRLPADFPAVRVANLLHLQQQLAIDTYADTVLAQAAIIVVRLLGGQAYWSYGLEVVKAVADRTGAHLLVLPGDDRPDPTLCSHSTVPLALVNTLWRYFTEGGIGNVTHALQALADHALGTTFAPPPPAPIPAVGTYTPPAPSANAPPPVAAVGLLFYRAHYLAGNTAPIEALCAALRDRALEPVPVFVSSLRDPDIQAEVRDLLQPKGEPGVALVLNTTSFAISSASDTGPWLWPQLNVPVLQVILSGGTVAQWEEQWQGLSPRDIAMNVALPEVDGRLISRAISFKTVAQRHAALETDVVRYEPVRDRVDFVADLAANWVRLRQTPPAERKIALILANYPTRDGRLANGVGLDTPASCVEILKALQTAGYTLTEVPQTSDALMQRLTAGVTNDPESQGIRAVSQSLSPEAFQQYFDQLPAPVRQGITQRWGQASPSSPQTPAPQMGEEVAAGTSALPVAAAIPIPGIQLGQVFVGIQPSRGYDRDPALNYHAPDLEPTPDYLAFYHWVRSGFGAHAVIHVGKHGNLEWLPGKGIALAATCYPEVALGPLPNLYPFIVNDPGEGAQAKRRSQAVILDHLTPPMTRAELYGPLQRLESLVDEYYEAQTLDPTRLNRLREQIATLLQDTNLQHDLETNAPLLKLSATQETVHPFVALDCPHPPPPSPRTGEGEPGSAGVPFSSPILGEENTRGEGSLGDFCLTDSRLPKGRGESNPKNTPDFETVLSNLDTYLCELKEAQIRDGLHIFGVCPTGRQLRDLIIAIARHPTPGRLGLTRAIAQDWQLDVDPLTTDPGTILAASERQENWRTVGDAIAAIEAHAAELVEQLLAHPEALPQPSKFKIQSSQAELAWIAQDLLPNLQNTRQELTHLLRGLNGEYVPAGASGAPTRGRPEVLPTGRNFYSVDIRAIPSETAWAVGRQAAEVLITNYTQEHGEYPKTLGLSLWGTSCMRTGGDDIAEALALLGVQPVWDGVARRVVDFEIVPLSVLGRPRVDVTLRISGFFRDAFPNLIDLFDQAVAAVAQLDEPAAMNPLAATARQEAHQWQQAGLTPEQAQARSRYRIFGSKPGAYGAGLQGLIDSQAWTSDRDLAQAYLNWSSYAYTGAGQGHAAPEAFASRLREMQVVLHNQDNREHDLLDSDDYYQFQGGLTAAVRTLRGRQPTTYFGDNAQPENPKVRHLSAEIARVYRSRVVNPKWIAGAMRHGYKGAFELAATVDYLFAYDATTHCVEDFMYEGVAAAYIFDPAVQRFIHEKNPWALRDMAERLLEAHQRGLWQQATPDTLEQLRLVVNEAEGAIEQTLM